ASCSPQLIQPHSISTLFPYTTLFRSEVLPILGVLEAGHFKNGMNGQRRGGYPCLFQCALKGTEIELFVLSPLPDHFDGRSQILLEELSGSLDHFRVAVLIEFRPKIESLAHGKEEVLVLLTLLVREIES